jgi:hypothetical protein
MKRSVYYYDLFIGVSIAAVLGVVYLTTIAPDITWANQGADGGDLITAAVTGGIPHPTGYPTYLILARFFQLLPIGTLAFRTNLLSALCSSMVAMLVYFVTLNWIDYPRKYKRIAGIIAGLAFGLSPLVWSQAVITEVYALHLLVFAVIIWLLPVGVSGNSPWIDRMCGLVFGLGMGNHLTLALLLPVWLLLSALPNKTVPDNSKQVPFWMVRRMDLRVIARRVVWLGLGLLVYTTLFMRARSGSPVNWENPQNWNNFWNLVSGRLYQERLFSIPLDYMVQRLLAWANLLLDQYGVWGVMLSLFGLFIGRPTYRRWYILTTWVVLVYSLFAVNYDSHDSQAYLIPVYFVFAIWIGWGVGELLSIAADRDTRLIFPVVIMIVFLVLLAAWQTYPEVDASNDDRAVVFGREVMRRAPANALLFTDTDQESSPISVVQRDFTHHVPRFERAGISSS